MSRRWIQLAWQHMRAFSSKFLDDRIPTHAAALAFSSMLSIVPFLAILFAILKAFDVHTLLAPLLLAKLSAGYQGVAEKMVRYVTNTDVTSMGIAGVGALLFSVMSTLSTVEDAFNQIWGITRGKAVHHKLRDYLMVIICVPILMSIAISITTTLQHQQIVSWLFSIPGFGPLLLDFSSVVPYVSIWLALATLYFFIPMAKSRLRSIFIAACVAGTSWQLAQWSYVHFQIGVSRYNVIYGTLALLPVFMIWVYVSWIIVLVGMELVYFLEQQRIPPFSPGFKTNSVDIN